MCGTIFSAHVLSEMELVCTLTLVPASHFNQFCAHASPPLLQDKTSNPRSEEYVSLCNGRGRGANCTAATVVLAAAVAAAVLVAVVLGRGGGGNGGGWGGQAT